MKYIQTSYHDQGQSFCEHKMWSNKAPRADGIYWSFFGFVDGVKITLKRQSIQSRRWIAEYHHPEGKIVVDGFGSEGSINYSPLGELLSLLP